jgi:Ca2+-binding RTX toxin-like protein
MLTNCTVSGNSASLGGGGLNNYGTATLTNTIVAGNTTQPNGAGSPSDIAGGVSGSYNLIGTGGSGGLSNNDGNHNQVGVTNPGLDPKGLQSNGGPTQTIALLPGSPALGTGSPALAVDPSTGQALTADQRGFAPSSMADIGAFQDQGFVLTPVTSSTPQAAGVGTAFTNPLAVTVTANNTSQFTNPVDGGIIGFTVNPAASGASAALSTTTATITGGQASVTARANTVAGSYTVTASAAGVPTPANFSLTNKHGTPAAVAVVSGSGQSVMVNTGFAGSLVVVVTDADGDSVPGVSVTFAAPTSGASATLISSTATTGANGQASVTATADTIAGNYTVTASVTGVTTPASFSLTNTPGAPASVAVVSGSGQSAPVAQGFTSPLVVVVKDSYGNLVPGASVTFAAPASGASATLSSATATTGATGQASVTATANTLAGSYSVTAAAAGVVTPASFALTQTLPTTGVSVVGTTLYIVSGSTPSDSTSVKPAGTKTDGTTGLAVSAVVNGTQISKTFTQTLATIIFAGSAGNETLTLASTLTLPATVTAGGGNDTVQLGAGNSTVILGDGNDAVTGGNGNDTVTLGTAPGKGNNTVTLGDGNDTVTLSGGNDTVTLGNGADTLTAGDGNNTVTVGNGTDTIQLGNGSNVVVEGNGTDTMKVGNGNNFLVGGLGSHTLTAGNGINILIDGSAAVTKSGDSFRQILNDWVAKPTASNQAAIRSRFTVNYNPKYANTLTAGSGIDWFFYKPPTTSNKKATDFLN